jgi:lysophospholipase L1-like esterase
MSRVSHLARGAAVVFATIFVASCENDNLPLGPDVPAGGALFKSYVAIGNSITAGYQSGGINDSTQKLSYAALLARQFGTRYAYPALAMPGCLPPMANFSTGALVGNAPAGTCALRIGALTTDILNNVAVPNAASGDPTSSSTSFSTPLTQFILGGKTQVQRALEAEPTFVTIWIGNNDILGPALSGVPLTQTPQATFVTNYAKMISELRAGAPDAKGVLISVGQVANVALPFSASLLASPAVLGGIAAVAGRPITPDPACFSAPGNTSRISFQLIPMFRNPAVPPILYCTRQTSTRQGDTLVIDAAEQLAVKAVIDGYNAYIKAKADSIGFAYFDVNITLDSLRTAGQVPPFPVLTAPTAPFGQYFSLDGVHPTGAAHRLVANGIIAAINAKFGTAVKPVP